MDTDWTQALTIIFSTVGVVFVFLVYLMSRMDNKFANVDNKFEQMLNRIDANQKENNTRFNGLENRLTSMESEMKNTNQRISDMGQKFDQRISDMGQKLDQRISDMKTDINQRMSTIEGYLVPKKVFDFKEHHKDDHEEEPKEN